MKMVHQESGEIIAYSKWETPPILTEQLKVKLGTNVSPDPTTNLRTSDPIGLSDALAEEMSARIVACRRSTLGQRPHICRNSIQM